MSKEIKTWQDRLRGKLQPSVKHTLTDKEMSIIGTDEMLAEIAELRAAIAASGGNAEPSLSDDALFNFWLYRDCMDAIRAGDMRAQFISAARAAIAASAPNAALVAALKRIALPVNAGCGCSCPCRCDTPEAEEINAQAMRDIADEALAALSAAGQEVGK